MQWYAIADGGWRLELSGASNPRVSAGSRAGTKRANGPAAMRNTLLALVLVGLSGCLMGDAPVERGWGNALAMVPGEDDGVWGVHAVEGAEADATPVALVEWLGTDPSGRVVQGVPDDAGGRLVQIDTPDGVWSAAVDAEGNLLWSDPIPEDPWAFAEVVADVGLALEQPDETACDTCTANIGPLAIALAVVVVGAAAAAIWTAFRDPPNDGRATPGGATTPSSGRSPREIEAARQACGPRPEGDIRKDARARRAYFEWTQCMARASR